MSHAISILALAILGFLHVQGYVHQVVRRVVQDPIVDRRVVVITWKDSDGLRCEISTDPELLREALKTTGGVSRPSEEEMQEVREECDSLRPEIVEEEDNFLNGAPAPEASEGWNIIFPGTKWCGAGDIAKHDDHLGFHEDTDRCCRAHDKCDDLMLAGETKNNLKNKSPFTALSCKCDHDFYDCLSRINSLTSNTVGNSYFNLLRRPCYAEDYPLSKKCKKYRTFLKLTCLEYARDTKAPKVFQWFSAKMYKQLPFPGPLTITLPF